MLIVFGLAKTAEQIFKSEVSLNEQRRISSGTPY